jgi:hypothetical protein
MPVPYPTQVDLMQQISRFGRRDTGRCTDARRFTTFLTDEQRRGKMETEMPQGDEFPDPNLPEETPPRDPESEGLPDDDEQDG